MLFRSPGGILVCVELAFTMEPTPPAESSVNEHGVLTDTDLLDRLSNTFPHPQLINTGKPSKCVIIFLVFLLHLSVHLVHHS